MEVNENMTISVVYLAYYNKEAGYEIETVENFFRSYSKHPSGEEHSLVIIAKNWNDNCEYKRLRELSDEYNAKIIDLPDDGWDFGAYFRVTKLLDTDYIVFLGSSTTILCDNWLYAFFNAFKNDESIQIVGAMGSWGYMLEGLTFPNYHIRTCSFMIKRELFLEYTKIHKFPVTKEDTYEIEHGKTSITNFVLDKGYKAVVVNSDGEIFAPEDWWHSKTFRYPGEWKSMLSDRHSSFYTGPIEKHRESMERASWGQSLKKTTAKIFVSYHNNAPLLQSEVFQPIFLNSNVFKDGAYTLRDNIGENISDKNDNYGTLTGQYWVWKNYLPRMDIEYIGFFQSDKVLNFNSNELSNRPFKAVLLDEFAKQFQLYTEENIVNYIKTYDVILPVKAKFATNIYEHYIKSYQQKDIDIALEILKEIYPQYANAANTFIASCEIYTCLNFIMKKELLNEYMQWSFNLLEIIEQKSNWSQENKKNRMAERLAEMFFNIWLIHNIEILQFKVLNMPGFLIYCDIQLYLADCLAQIQQEN